MSRGWIFLLFLLCLLWTQQWKWLVWAGVIFIYANFSIWNRFLKFQFQAHTQFVIEKNTELLNMPQGRVSTSSFDIKSSLIILESPDSGYRSKQKRQGKYQHSVQQRGDNDKQKYCHWLTIHGQGFKAWEPIKVVIYLGIWRAVCIGSFLWELTRQPYQILVLSCAGFWSSVDHFLFDYA